MNCKELQKHIMAFLKEEMDVKTLKSFIEHIEGCKNCKEELSIQYLVEKGLEHLEDGNAFDLQRELKNKIEAAKVRIRRREIAINAVCYFFVICILCILIILLVGVLT